MEEEYFVISLLSDNGDKLGINIPAQSTTFVLTASFNIIEEAFSGLRGLYHQSPQRVTMTDLLNKLLSNSSSDYQLCASVFPLKCLEQLCTECLNLDALRVFVEASCVLYPEMSCHEVDVDGNQYSLKRFFTHPQGQNSGTNGRISTGSSPTSDKQLVKDVTDALRNKLLELRLTQEQGHDSYEIEASLVAIWQNAKILWSIDSYGDSAGAALSEKWTNILQWSKSTHKKQVKSDAKLVLATRMCLEEQGQYSSRQPLTNNSLVSHTSEVIMPPAKLLTSINSLEFWCLTFLSEFCGARNSAQDYLLPYIHKLLCPLECSAGMSGAALAYPLNDQHTFSKTDSIDISKNLRVHLHRYHVNICPQEVAMYVHSHPYTHTPSEKQKDHEQRRHRPVTSPTPLASNSQKLHSSPHSFFDDDDENNAHISSNINLNMPGNIVDLHDSSHHTNHAHGHPQTVTTSPEPWKAPHVSTTPTRRQTQTHTRNHPHPSPLPRPTRSHSPKRRSKGSGDTSRVVQSNNRQNVNLRGVTDTPPPSLQQHDTSRRNNTPHRHSHSHSHSHGRSHSPGHGHSRGRDTSPVAHENPNDTSIATLGSNMTATVVEARSPPRRQPHPYPRYSPTPSHSHTPHTPHSGSRPRTSSRLRAQPTSRTSAGLGGNGRAAGRVTQSRVASRSRNKEESGDGGPCQESALDYLNPLNDTKLSINELNDSCSLDINITPSTTSTSIEKQTKNGIDQEIKHDDSRTPKYNRPTPESASSSSSRQGTTPSSNKAKRTPPKELYDRSGHRIKSKDATTLSKSQHLPSSSQKSSHTRRKSFSMGDTFPSSRGQKETSVAFGRRLTHSERSLPAAAAVSKSTDSIIDTDPEYAQARALYRLRNVRRQEQDAKAEAAVEEKLRRERLRALELKADTCRLQHSQSKHLKSPPSSHVNSQSHTPRRRKSLSPTTSRRRASSTGRTRSHFDFEAEEGRRRAAERIKHKRQEMREKELHMRQREYEKKQERWDIRDEKINAFLDRQLSKGKSTPSGASSRGESRSGTRVIRRDAQTPTAPDRSLLPGQHASQYELSPEAATSLHINWELEDVHVGNALRKADDVTFQIDNTLGGRASQDGRVGGVVASAGAFSGAVGGPRYSGESEGYAQEYEHDYEYEQHGHPHADRDEHPIPTSRDAPSIRQQPPTPSHMQQHMQPPGSVPYSPSTAAQDMLCIKVLRAYGLPDLLGGTNPYIFFDWGHLGRASTHAVRNTTSPEFNATLRFKSPSAHGSALGTALMSAPPLGISVHSRNESVSDTVIGGIRLDDKDLNSNHPLRVHLYTNDGEQAECGVLEFQVYVI